MGNFEKLSVLVIGVIIVMILVVAVYTWMGDPAEPETNGGEPAPLSTPTETAEAPDEEPGWLGWTDGEGSGAEEDAGIPVVPETELEGSAEASPEPAPEETAEPEEAAAERTYTVKPGQTLSHISLEVYGTTKHWPAIAERNGVDPARIRPGMDLIIPAIAASTPAAANKPGGATTASAAGGPAPGSTYTVRSGDTIQKISQAAFGTIERWTDIWLANFERVEDPRFLRAGMTLRIPN